MALVLNKNEAAIIRGIKTVGIGKKGSRSLDSKLADEILRDLTAKSVDNIAKGAFFGALFIKGVDQAEEALDLAFTPGTLTSPEKLVSAICPESSEFIQSICVRLLKKEELTRNEAYQTGQFLLSSEPDEAAKGLIVSVLRVRYETPDEYEGLLQSFQESLESEFRTKPATAEPIVQIAEPFDGVDHSFLLTPLLTKAIQQKGYTSVMLAGENSGPKFGNNLLDIALDLGIKPLKNNKDLTDTKPRFGYLVDQKDLSTPLYNWVERRRKTIKRPCFATLEKFLNPVSAKILIASAFHPPYGEKMLTIAERAGFPGAIIVRNGLEGTLAFALKRQARVLCSAWQADGSYKRNEFIFDPERDFNIQIDVDEKYDSPSLSENVKLIENFDKTGKSGNGLFDQRVRITTAGLTQGIRWLEENITCG